MKPTRLYKNYGNKKGQDYFKKCVFRSIVSYANNNIACNMAINFGIFINCGAQKKMLQRSNKFNNKNCPPSTFTFHVI